jgi:signal transduction histidine kinase
MNAREVILVVDDEVAGRFVKVQTLRRAGFEVIEAANGADGLELARGARPMLVVLDVNLPDMSGLEVTRRLRESASGPPSVQILQVSNTAIQPADRVRGLNQGADVYLTEPIDGDVLIATVHALLRVRRAELALAQALESERQARAAAEEASRLKDEFIATLSHELRTPLNALMGWIWQLQHTALNDDARGRALESLERNARTQAQLINDLLDVSRISKGKLQLQMQLVDLGRTVTEATDSLREPIARKKIRFKVTTVPVYVAGDVGRLQQVVTNLLTNAIQFTPSAGKIDVSVTVEGDEAVLRVQDTGAGIDPAVQQHIFDPFRQGEGGLSRQHGGLGLGLAVVRQLVELHGGNASVKSEGVGRGSTFVVRLPRETVSGQEAKDRVGQPLLNDVNVQFVPGVAVSDWSGLAATLESSGANVLSAVDTDAPVPAAAVIVASEQAGRLTFRLGTTPERAMPVPSDLPPGDIVRRIARFVAESKVS